MTRRNWLPYHCCDWQDKSDGAHVSSPQTLMKVMNGHEKITPAQSLSWLSSLAHPPPSLSPPPLSPSGKFTVACQGPWAPDPYRSDMEASPEAGVSVRTDVLPIKVSARHRDEDAWGELSLFLCDSQVYPVMLPPFYLLRLATNQKRWVVYNAWLQTGREGKYWNAFFCSGSHLRADLCPFSCVFN